MKLEKYRRIMDTISATRLCDCLQVLQEKFPDESENTLMSIYGQYYQHKVKKIYLKHIKSSDKYYRKYLSAVYHREHKGFLTRHAYDVDYPPSLYARLVLDQFYRDSAGEAMSKSFISKQIKDTSQIEDEQLSREVELCNVNDNCYGPYADKGKRECGLRYEKVIADYLHAQGIPYAEEDTLRKEGYDKTPDFKLVVPVGIDNRVVNWIECKALFGTEESHQGYLENQFWSYTNRFGPGLVVYWFGFVDELNVNSERGVILSDRLPENIVTLESLLDQTEKEFKLTF